MSGWAVPVIEGDGVNSYLEIGAPSALQLANNSPFTIEGWVWMRTVGSRNIFFSKNSSRGSPYTFMFGCTDSGDMAAFNGSAWCKPNPAVKVPTGGWHHLAYSFDGTVIRFILDGQGVGSATYSFVNTAAHTVKIGGYSNNTDINGYISDMRFWDHARGETQIREAMHRRLNGAEPGLLGYWPLFDGSGAMAANDLAQGNSGVLTGNAAWADKQMLPIQYLMIEGAPAEHGAPTPPYGATTNALEQNSVLECNAPGGLQYTPPDNRIRAICSGYQFYTNRNTAPFTTGTTTAFTYTHNTNFNGAVLAWQWEREFEMAFSAGSGGTVSTGGGWYAEGELVSVTATPGTGGHFSRWSGNVPPAERFNATLRFSAAAPVTAEAVFGSSVIHVSPSGNDGNGGTGWADALKTIGAAIDKARDGDMVLVTNGTYAITKQLTVTNAITLASVNGRDATEIRGTSGFRLLLVDHAEAGIVGFTLSQGRSDAASPGGGFMIGTRGGTVRDCRVTRCTSGWAANSLAMRQEAGLVSHCIMDGTVTSSYGSSGTCYMNGGLMENCLIFNNLVHNDGGGLYISGGTARNCTIIGNSASRNGSGVYRSGTGVLANCIIRGNIHRLTPNLASHDLYGGTSATVFNCNTPAGAGTAPVAGDACFVDAANGDFRLRAASPCIDAGLTYVNMGVADFGGAARVAGAEVDIGAFEYDTASFSCGFQPTVTAGMAPLETEFVPKVYGTTTDPGLLGLVWRISDGVNAPEVIAVTGLQSLMRTLAAGWHTVTLEVTDPAVPATVTSVLTNAVGVSPAKLFVVTANNGAAAPYATWETAATNLHDTLRLAWGGATIVVSNGTYDIKEQLFLSRAVTMESVNGMAVTTVRAPQLPYVRVAMLANASATIKGFTLRDGRGGNGSPGGGVLITEDGGTLYGCRITGNVCGNYDAFGGGINMRAGRVSNCIIDNNRLQIDSMQGVGVYQFGGILENSLIVTNKTYSLTQSSGGGVHLNGSGIVRNCTIVGNTAANGGGIRRNGGKIQNCIIVDNLTGADTGAGAPNWYGAHATDYQNNCTPAEVGTGCVTAAPEFVDAASGNYQLRLGSPCIDAGLPMDGLPETDLADLPRVTGAGIDIGAYEYDARELSCALTAVPARAVAAADAELTALFFGFEADTNDLHFAWVLDDEAGAPVKSGMGLDVVRHSYNALGRYNVRLTVTDPVSEKTASIVITNAVHIAPATLYLVQSNSLPVAPYDTWAKAATNIHNAVAEAVGGSTVLISNGTYDVSQTITLGEGIVLRGINGGFGGWDQVVLKGRKVAGVRILDLNHGDALAEGLTIRGGKAAYIGFGGGVNITDGTLRRCLITDNDQGGYTIGSGVHQVGGLISGCIISNNAPCESAGGLALKEGICENTLITASRAASGGGVKIEGGILRNCTISGNTATLNDANNENRGGGGLWRIGGTVINCIIWGNTANNPSTPGYPDWSDANAASQASQYKNNCTSVAVGENGIVADPLFRDAAGRDYRLTRQSPCRDLGLYQEWMAGATDLWGNQRVVGGLRVDIGAHEEQSSLSTVLILR